jgi:hypothetical protein
VQRRGFSTYLIAVSAAAILAAATVAGTVLATATVAKTSATTVPARDLVQIKVLSTRPDLVSAGEALTQIILPAGVNPSSVRVDVSGLDVTHEFAMRSNGKFEGLVTGLANGPNILTARLPNGYGAHLTIGSHPIGGPVFSGPQIQPWQCQSGAKDKQCDQPTAFAYYYIPSSGGGFQSYDPNNPPPDSQIATTTTTDGVTVPFIIRQETGYMDRDQYAIATLWQPGKAWEPWAPQQQYNGRLVITHGASCDTTYGTGSAPSVQDQKVLGGGFIVMSTALDNAGHNCNILTEAESLEMAKEWVVDHYGEIKWTIGSGCSGGSLVQQQVANAFPGIYQGITPQCSFTDAWSSAMEYEDYYMLLNYWKTQDQGDGWGPSQIQAVIEHPNPGNPITFTTAIPNSGVADRSGCPDVSQSQEWSASNPHGVRCTLEDYMVNLFGRYPDTGYAMAAFDNVGIQYGLDALRNGQITAQQFADLNAHLGGIDVNGHISSVRANAPTVALQRAYADGAVDTASNLNDVAIIDLRGPDEGSFHDVYRTYAMRDRLLQNFGTAANQILWRGPVPLLGDSTFADAAIYAEDGWLAKVYADHRDIPLSQKIIQDKPDTVADRCTNGSGTDVPAESCDETVIAYGTPRFGADEPKTDDVLKCQLKPLDRSDYQVTFTDAEWQELQQAFPTGVCDYTKPGVEQGPTTPWKTYQDQNGNVIYGGRSMGPAPVSVPFAPTLGCPVATGRLSGRSLGPVQLGMTRPRVRAAFAHSSTRGRRDMEFFCLSPIGVRVGFAQGRTVLLLTANRHYALRGVRPGARLAAVSRRLHAGRPFHIGLNYWYLVPDGSVTGVLKVRHGMIEEIGIATRSFTRSRRASMRFLRGFR